jgi:hypothetical protein
MTDEQLLEYRRVKLLERDKQISKLVEENSKLREGLREDLREEVSLRDHFASLAMQGLLAADKRRQLGEKGVCLIAYSQADAMLAEREKRDG